jgi:hypothetical protein
MGILSPEDMAFWRRVSTAIQRAMALGLFIIVHLVLNRALVSAVPANMVGALVYLQGIIFAIFALIYVYLAWDILTAFFPGLKVMGTAESKLLESDDES